MKVNDENPKCDLADCLGELEARLPRMMDENFMFQRATFPPLPPVFSTSRIEICKAYRVVNDCWRTEVLNFRASRTTYRNLALAILAVVFRQEVSEISISIDSPQSTVKLVKIRYPGATPRAVFNYLTQPLRFEYHPQDVHEHPWSDRRIPETDWPEFLLTKSTPLSSRDQWEARDQIEGFGNDDSAVLVAALLLDLGRDDNRQPVARLESAAGFGGVSKLSAEVAFHLPESEQWPELL